MERAEEQVTVSSVLRTFPEDVVALLEGRGSVRDIQLPSDDLLTGAGQSTITGPLARRDT